MTRPVLALRHVPHEGLGTLAEILKSRGLSWQYRDWFAEPRAQPRFDAHAWSGLVVLGGPMNVDQVDQHPFLALEVDWIRTALAADLPILGICLGSQLMAKALGARVSANNIKEIGWYNVELADAAADDRLFADCQPSEIVFQWHGDSFDLPPGATLLARSTHCENQAFRFGQSAYALQFHIEVTGELIETWLDEQGNCCELAQLDYIDPAAIRAQTPGHISGLTVLGSRVLGRFADLCRERADTTP